jgi:DNA-binding response OmpR family regulator
MTMLVLVVEDDPLIALDLCSIAQEAGCVTVAAPTVSSARETAAEYPFDLAIIDLKLGPGSNGADLAREFLGRYGLPSLIVSGHLTDAVRSELIDTAVFTIAKPYEPQAVRAAIFAALEPRNELLA